VLFTYSGNEIVKLLDECHRASIKRRVENNKSPNKNTYFQTPSIIPRRSSIIPISANLVQLKSREKEKSKLAKNLPKLLGISVVEDYVDNFVIHEDKLARSADEYPLREQIQTFEYLTLSNQPEDEKNIIHIATSPPSASPNVPK